MVLGKLDTHILPCKMHTLLPKILRGKNKDVHCTWQLALKHGCTLYMVKYGNYMQKNEVGFPSTSLTKINLKWIKNLNISPETTKLLEGNIGNKLLEIEWGNDFLDRTPRPQATKWKNQQMGLYIKPKLFTAKKQR